MSNNWEVELKFEVENELAVSQKLSELGFEPRGTESHCDVYFRHPCRDFRATDEAFRLRQVDSRAYVTYKGKRLPGKVKTRPEIELTLEAAELDSWRKMLEQLGFGALPPVRKQRRVFQPNSFNQEFSGFIVTLDNVEQLGLFAEVELLVDDERSLSTSQQRVETLGKRLGLSHEQTRSYLSQLLEKLGVE